jgi:hypothetical protein
MNLQIALSFEWRLGQLGCTSQSSPERADKTKKTRSAELVGCKGFFVLFTIKEVSFGGWVTWDFDLGP